MNQALNQQFPAARRLGKIAANRERLRKLAGRLADALLPTLPQLSRPQLRPVLVRPRPRRS
jgi:hypothetical protein